MMVRFVLLLLCCIATAAPTRAGTSTFEIPNPLPPIVKDTTRAVTCTVTYLVTDITTNDMIAVRTEIASDLNDKPANNLMPCPANIPPRVAARALEECARRAADQKDCVFADMGREFEHEPKASNTAENYSRCASDKATDIGVACWRSGELQICDAGCGGSPDKAIAAAVSRCEAKQQRQCPITGSLPVLAPR